jgi:hypothetical protein
MSKDKVLEGLKKMDPKNDNHWTMTGEAKLETVKFLSGGFAVTREELNEFAPGFNRESMQKYVDSLAAEAGNATVQEPGPAGPGAGNGTVTPVADEAKEDVGSPNGEVDVEALAEEVARANEAVLELQRLQIKVREDLVAAETKRDALIDSLHVVSPPTTHQQSVVAYLQRGHQARLERAAAMRKLAGLEVDDLMAKASPSPIDQMMRNRRRK